MSESQTPEEEIRQLRERVEECEKLIDELSTPIIPSIIPETMLVPLTGSLNEKRLDNIQKKVLFSIQKQKADTVLIDFTGISHLEVEELGLQNLIYRISELQAGLNLMGVETIFVGFKPNFAHEMVISGVDTSKFITHATFRDGLKYLMSKKGLEFIETAPAK
ncbi:STAS domain-containing protein [Rossellomorea vietnamensis]|uniref:STAS domain-containing protein n=2 Tax=Rossellomorea TaxID=2837508 RepID=A0A5D4KAT2_9BACI|nr:MULTISPECIES: STAS domain-containing protein [Rossellomorea]TYR74481.1 STAS domain-containing protein [Rossellomorea vietnamensis]TYS72029.1 STAS domain-containing protein [Rossellomorea aquimaris]